MSVGAGAGEEGAETKEMQNNRQKGSHPRQGWDRQPTRSKSDKEPVTSAGSWLDKAIALYVLAPLASAPNGRLHLSGDNSTVTSSLSLHPSIQFPVFFVLTFSLRTKHQQGAGKDLGSGNFQHFLLDINTRHTTTTSRLFKYDQ